MKKVLLILMAVLLLVGFVSCNQDHMQEIFNEEYIEIKKIDYSATEEDNLLILVTASEKANKLWYRLGSDGEWDEMSLTEGKEFSEQQLLQGISFRATYTRITKGIEEETINSPIHYLDGWLVKTTKTKNGETTDITRSYLLKSVGNIYYDCEFTNWKIGKSNKGTLSGANFSVNGNVIYEFCREDNTTFSSLDDLLNAASDLKAYLKTDSDPLPFGKNVGPSDEVSFIVSFITEEEVEAPTSQQVKNGETVIEPEEPTKDNFRFMGWFADESLETEWDFETAITENTSIYAKFVPNNTVTYFDNGSTSGTVPEDSTYYLDNDSVTVLGNTGSLARTGYTFDGWNTKSDGTGTDYAASATFEITEAVELYAKWKANQYTVTFDKNDSNATAPSSTSVSVTYDSAYGSLATTSLSHYSYEWYDAQTGGNKIEATTIVSKAEDHTLYAHWTENGKYTVQFNKNTSDSVSGSTLTPLSAQYINEDSTIPSYSISRTGYTFDGWNTQADGKGTKYTSGGTFTSDKAGSVTLYAMWKPIEYTITYKSLGGAGFTGTHGTNYPTKHTYGSDTALDSPTRTGYTFGGWYTESACNGTAITTLGKTDYTSNITLYVKWTANKYKVVFNSNYGTDTGTGSMDDQTGFTYDTAAKALTANGFTKTNSPNVFKEWNTKADGTGTGYADKQEVKNLTSEKDGIVNLYAIWTTAITTFNLNSKYTGSTPCVDGTTNNTKSGDTAFTLPTMIYYSSTDHTKGFAVTKWNTKADGTGTDYNAGESYTPTSSKTLYIKEGHSWVQLWAGGPKWAEFNVGSTITDYASANQTSIGPAISADPLYCTDNVGGLYGWGDSKSSRRAKPSDSTTPGSSTDYYDGTDYVDGNLKPNCDTANILWGSNWRMPTEKNFTDLWKGVNLENGDSDGTNTKWEWCDGTSKQYVSGCTLAGWKIKGKGAYANNSIFIPCAGQVFSNNLGYQGINARYWTSTYSTQGYTYAKQLVKSSSTNTNPSIVDSLPRSDANSVRAIIKE